MESPKGYKVYTTGNKEDTAGELNANRMAIWLDAQGENYNWVEVSIDEVQKKLIKVI